MTRLRQLVLGLGSVFLTCGVAQGQAKLGLYVVDAADQKVGYAGFNAFTAVIFIEGSAYATGASRKGFTIAATGNGPALYTERFCAGGVAYLPSNHGDLLGSPVDSLYPHAWVTTDGYFNFPSPASAVVPVKSRAFFTGDFVLETCTDLGGAIEPWDAGLFFAAPVPGFTPPFRVVEGQPASPAPAQATFNDVPTSHPFFKYIEAMVAAGITGGCSTNPPLYCPNSPLTRGQIAVFLSKALGL